MTEDEIKTVWLESIDHYGKEKQSIVCMEECAELIKQQPPAISDLTDPLSVMDGETFYKRLRGEE